MPGERKENVMSRSFSRVTNSMDQETAKEFLWGCTLTKDRSEATWNDGNDTDDEEDTDYIMHTLLAKQVLVGKDARDGERQVVEVETKGFNHEKICLPIAVVTPGKCDMVALDLTLPREIPITFRLSEGSGPIHVTAQHIIEFREETEPELEYTEDDATETEEESVRKEKGAKRKAGPVGRKGKQRGKLDSSAASTGDDDDDDDDEEEEEEDEDESMEEEDEEESEEEEETESPEKPKKKRGSSVKAVKAVKGVKTTPTSKGAKNGVKRGKKAKAK